MSHIVNGERKEVFLLRIVRGRSRKTKRGSGESHLVNGERKEVFVLRIVRGRSRRYTAEDPVSSHIHLLDPVCGGGEEGGFPR